MIEVVFETHELLFIDKPQGISSQPGESAGRSVPDLLEKSLGYRPSPLHRLDRDTSGIMALAKDRASAAKWSKRMTDGIFSKEYFAFVFNTPVETAGTIDEEIDQRGRTVSAITKYHVVATSRVGDRIVSLLSLRLETGRMHQIRIHLRNIGSPVIGDDKHGDFALNKEFVKLFRVAKLMLLSKSLEYHDIDDAASREIFVRAAWPDRFNHLAALASIDLPDEDRIGTAL